MLLLVCIQNLSTSTLTVSYSNLFLNTFFNSSSTTPLKNKPLFVVTTMQYHQASCLNVPKVFFLSTFPYWTCKLVGKTYFAILPEFTSISIPNESHKFLSSFGNPLKLKPKIMRSNHRKSNRVQLQRHQATQQIKQII